MTRRLPRWVLVAGILAAGVLMLAALVPIGFCDGPAPGWAENRGGCATWTLLEYAYPWHWGVPDQCLGLCGGIGD